MENNKKVMKGCSLILLKVGNKLTTETRPVYLRAEAHHSH